MELRAGPAPCLAEHPPDLIIYAVRWWCSARCEKLAVLPRLVQVLAPYCGEMLAPVFDALFSSFEACLGRSILEGRRHYLSSDEHELLGLIDSPNLAIERFSNSGTVEIFYTALVSARAMCELDPAHCRSFRLANGSFEAHNRVMSTAHDSGNVQA